MIDNYVEFALFSQHIRKFSKEDILSFEKKYKNYNTDKEWESLEDEFGEYIVFQSIKEIISFMEKIKLSILDKKYLNNLQKAEVIYDILFRYIFSWYIEENKTKYINNLEIKKYLFNLLVFIKKLYINNDYLDEKINLMKNHIYVLYKWITWAKYNELINKKN